MARKTTETDRRHYHALGKYPLNVVPSLPDHNDYLVGLPEATKLPPYYTLAPHVPRGRDQGQEGSCTGFGSSGARMSRLMATSGRTDVLSAAFPYYEARALEHSTDQDSGAMIRDVLRVLKHKGVCRETDMPYKVGDYAKAPSDTAVKDAAEFMIASYHRVHTLHQMKFCLTLGQPVIFGIMVYESFEKIGRDGIVPIPRVGEAALGGHCLWGYEYNDNGAAPGGGIATAQNSWSEDFGHNGDVFFPYAYLFNLNYCFEVWTIS